MKFLEWLRNKMFWTLDSLKGGHIKKHRKDIAFILKNYENQLVKDRLETYQKNLLSHAVKTTPFYKLYDPNKGLNHFPVIHKNIIRERSEDFKSSHYLHKKNKQMATSGSTGTPLAINQNNNKVDRNTADTIYFSEQAHFKIGYKLCYLRLWEGHLKRSKLKAWLQNIWCLEILHLNDPYISNFINTLKRDTSNKGFIGYASGLERICKYLDQQQATPMQTKMRSIIAISEGLNAYTKKAMSYYFNAPVVSRYSNTENGILAQQEPNGLDAFTINWASYHMEILKLDNEEPVKPGDLGRIVITDLFNYAMPMIRYDTGDLGSIDSSKNPPVFKKIEGRKSDVILNTNGDIVSSFLLFEIAHNPDILQIQCIQNTQNEYCLKLNVKDVFHSEKEILNKLKKHLGKDAIIEVQYVNDIPLLASGKRKITINNYIK